MNLGFTGNRLPIRNCGGAVWKYHGKLEQVYPKKLYPKAKSPN